jgi:ribosomal protein S24E
MELKSIQEMENPLFKRKVVVVETVLDIVPSKNEVAEELAKKYSVDKEAIDILQIVGKFGEKLFTIKANIYENKDEKEKTMLTSKKQRDAVAKAKKDEEKAKAESLKQQENKPEESAPKTE